MTIEFYPLFRCIFDEPSKSTGGSLTVKYPSSDIRPGIVLHKQYSLSRHVNKVIHDKEMNIPWNVRTLKHRLRNMVKLIQIYKNNRSKVGGWRTEVRIAARTIQEAHSLFQRSDCRNPFSIFRLAALTSNISEGLHFICFSVESYLRRCEEILKRMVHLNIDNSRNERRLYGDERGLMYDMINTFGMFIHKQASTSVHVKQAWWTPIEIKSDSGEEVDNEQEQGKKVV